MIHTVFSHELLKAAFEENREAITASMERLARDRFDTNAVIFVCEKSFWTGKLLVEARIYRPMKIEKKGE